MNKIILLGRLTKDPEMKYSAEGKPHTRFTIAVDRDREKAADFIYCIAFGKTAEAVGDYCRKGRQVLVEGRLEINMMVNNDTGEKRSFTTVIVNQVEFLAKAKGDSAESQQPYREEPMQQRFQPTSGGWRNPSDVNKAY